MIEPLAPIDITRTSDCKLNELITEVNRLAALVDKKQAELSPDAVKHFLPGMRVADEGTFTSTKEFRDAESAEEPREVEFETVVARDIGMQRLTIHASESLFPFVGKRVRVRIEVIE